MSNFYADIKLMSYDDFVHSIFNSEKRPAQTSQEKETQVLLHLVFQTANTYGQAYGKYSEE